MKLRINITEENIQKGRRCDNNRFPIALALRDVGATGIDVGGF